MTTRPTRLWTPRRTPDGDLPEARVPAASLLLAVAVPLVFAAIVSVPRACSPAGRWRPCHLRVSRPGRHFWPATIGPLHSEKYVKVLVQAFEDYPVSPVG